MNCYHFLCSIFYIFRFHFIIVKTIIFYSDSYYIQYGEECFTMNIRELRNTFLSKCLQINLTNKKEE